ncbi:PAS domain S-box protein [Microvirga sp. CF3062]|uniref:PAS domain-containing sensor histidine kinase n=1 Tax=Microvirga sp. CF3062 TaxID=3110182 RepID=UPI002E75E530|nr:PAS domain S-box protein [Microvirga sp. CF3062]MEE1657908.1 PAS domain S-box protein [Microvirga sp. CF3062]
MSAMHGKPEAPTRAPEDAPTDRLQFFFQQAPGMIAIVSGPDHVFEFANTAYLDLVGRREVVGQRVRDVLPELDEQGTVALLDKVYATGEPFIGRRMPVAFQRQANAPAETRYMDFVYQPVVEDRGQVTGIFAQGFDVTQQVETEAAFNESEARYRLFSEETREGVVIHNGEVILDCNPAYARIFGYSSVAEVIGLPSTAFVTRKSAALLQEKGALGNEEPYEIEAVRKDGSVFPAEFVGRPSTWQGQNVRIGLARDLSERKRREAALRESEAHFAAIFDQSAAGFSEADLTGRLLRVNDRFCEITGYPREELVNGRRMQDITHPDDLPENLALFQKAIESGEPFEIEKRYIRPDGSEVWVSNTVTLIHDAAGQAHTMASVSIDLTARREAEAALRQSESRLRLALDAGRMAVWESDSRTNSVRTSPELNRLLGFSEDASPSIEEIRARYAPGAQDQLRTAAAAALGRGERYAEEELEIIWPDGSRHWLLLRADLEVTRGADDAASIKATGVAFEITERKLWEERQHLLINELNHRVKNTLATVQSLAAQSFRDVGASSGPNFTAFQERLFALARAHDILTRDNWEGAELRDIVGEVIEPYCRESSGRCDIDGPRVRLTPSMALALSMAVHELATNAAKYGALSVSTGQVSISWSVLPGNPRQLTLCWQEQGGPPVAFPKRKGFGTRLIERSLAQELAGEVSLAYVPTGVVCTVKAPLPEGMA